MAKQKTRKTLLTLGLIAGGGLLANEVFKEQTGNRSANVNSIFGRELSTAELKQLAEILTSDTRFISNTKGGKGDTGSGLIDLLKIAIPHVPENAHVAGTVVKTVDSAYLVIQDAPGGTVLTNTAFFYKLHGPDMSGPRGAAFTYADFTPAQIEGLKVKGLDGLNAPNWGGSLVKNGSYENGKEGWDNNTTIAEGLLNGSPIATLVSSSVNNNIFYVDPGSLYRITYYARGSVASARAYLYNLTITGAVANKITGFATVSNAAHTIVNEFTKYTIYVGGEGNLERNFSANARCAKLGFTRVGAGELQIARTIVEKISLGEPVPSNLPWLPSGQMVYDTVTGELGRYNGTAVVWAA